MTGTDWTCPKCGTEHIWCECRECQKVLRDYPPFGQYAICGNCNAEVKMIDGVSLLSEEEVADLPAAILQMFDLLRRRRPR